MIKKLKLDAHDTALVTLVKATLDAAIASAHAPSAVAKRLHSLAARHRMKGRAAAMKRHPFNNVCEASGAPIAKKYPQRDQLDPEKGDACRPRWGCSGATYTGPPTSGATPLRST